MQGPGRRLAVIGFAVALIGVTLTGCGQSDEPRVLGRGPTSAVNGFAPITVPLSPRQTPTIVAGGHFVLVYGGGLYDDSINRVRPRGDGAIYDVTKGEWTALPDLPFPHPLYSSSGTWTGSEFVITGTPCAGPPESDGDWFDCHPGGHAIGTYSPTTGTWRVIKVPPGLTADDGGQMTPIPIRALGFANSRVVFDATVSVNDPRRLLLLDPTTGASKLVTVPDAGTDTVCVTGQKLIAAHTGDDNPGPILTFELDAALSWKQLASVPRDTVGPALFLGQPHCSPQHLVYFPILQPPVGLDAGALWYRPDQQRWEPLPRFGSLGFPNLEPSSLGGTRALWNGRGDEMYLLPSGATAWVRVEHPPGAGAFLAGELDNAILMKRVDEEPARTTLALFDPNAFLKPQG